jgi:hypothetical protein
MSSSSLRRFWPRGRRAVAVATVGALLSLGACRAGVGQYCGREA